MRRLPLRRVTCGLGLLGILLAGVRSDAAQAIEKWGPFRGRVVDIETGEPIAGAAVLVVWFEMVPSLAHTTRKFFDARETQTDADGRFEVPRRDPPFFEFRIFPPEIRLLKPGYAQQREIVTPADGQPFVAPTEIALGKLKTRQELWEKSRGRPTGVPDDRMPGFIKAMEAEHELLFPGSRPSLRRQP